MTRILGPGLILGLMASASAAQHDAEPTMVIAGRCVDADGDPVAHAHVTLYRHDYREELVDPVRTVLSGAGGEFEVTGVPVLGPADWGYSFYFVVAEAKGRAQGFATIRSEDVDPTALALPLLEPATLRGRILDESDRPIAGARVRIAAIGPDFESALHLVRELPRLGTVTDAEGRFRIDGLAKDTGVRLAITHPTHAQRRLQARVPDEIDIALGPGGTITGRVLTADGEPAPFVRVQTQGARGNGGWMSVRADERGRYRLESLAPGVYNVWAKKAGWTVRAHDSFPIDGGEETESPALVLVRGGFVTGRVVDAVTRKPVEPGETADVGLYGPSRPRSGAAIEAADIAADGSFRIRVAPGSNYVYLRAGPGWEPAGAGARTLAVREGETIEVEFQVVRAGGGK